MVQFLLVDLQKTMKPWIQRIDHIDLGPHLPRIERLIEERHQCIFKGDQKGRTYARWLNALPDVTPSLIDLDQERIQVGCAGDLPPREHGRLLSALKAMIPWRKGPFEIFNIQIDSEWDSSLKWNRVKSHIADLAGRRILDIGSSCGYYLFRMAAKAPSLILGIEPFTTFYSQFLALQRYIQAPNTLCLPVKLEEMPPFEKYFDTVFCMGILYHRRSPLDCLMEIRKQMRKDGELVLETLIIPGDSDTALFPAERYAKMRNVFFLPTVNCLRNWLRRAGFHQIRCIDITRTTLDEQRKTQWIQSESLEDFLDPDNAGKTIEGYPAPTRAMILANSRT